MIRFIDREYELSLLNEEWEKNEAQFVIVYGRRRIGKTTLISEFIKDKPGIFYIADDVNKKVQINDFKEKIASFFDDDLLKNIVFEEWKDLFEYLKKILPKNKRLHITIDEFSYFIKNDPALASVLQKFWDTFLKKTRIFLLVSGSIFGLMSEKILSASSPLYGRRTRDILLKQLTLKDACEFTKTDFEEKLKIYMGVGGVPEYLLKAKDFSSSKEFFKKEFVSKDGYFYREPYYLLSQEFKEIKTYFTILNAIAYGNTKPSEIANFVGVKTREIYPYLENLLRLDFIEKLTPITRSKKTGVYLIKDVFFDCWFNLVFNNREDIERGQLKFNEKEINTYFDKQFETISRNDFIPKIFTKSKVGKWWHRDKEIDIVAINEKEKQIVFFECKWKTLGYQKCLKILEELQEKAEYVEWLDGKCKKQYGVIAKKIDDKSVLRKKGYLVYDLDDWKSTLQIP